MSAPIYKEFNYRGFNIKIMWDTELDSPADWDNLGTFFSNCRSFNPYNLGIDEILEEDEDGAMHIDSDFIFLRVYAYIHGGIALSTTRTGQFADTWDSGFAGVMAVHKDKVLKEYGDLSPETIEKVYKVLEGEVEEWNDYCHGNVFGYEIENEDGSHFASCWGFYGDPDYCISEAKSVVDYYREKHPQLKQQELQLETA